MRRENTNSMPLGEDVFGMILQAQHEQEDPVSYSIERDDDYLDCHTATSYFCGYKEWSDLEQDLIDQAQGSILDIGCGAGRHSLYLQKNGYRVTGLDISEGALAVAKGRGVKTIVTGSIFNLQEVLPQQFDTLLIMGNNLPLGGSPEGIVGVLRDCHKITPADGTILMNFVSPLPVEDQLHLNFQEENLRKGRKRGQFAIRVRYKNLYSAWFDFYLPTLEELSQLLESSHWSVSSKNNLRNLHYVKLVKS